MTHKPLSPQEEALADLILQGKSYREIAAQLRLSYETVKTYAKRLRKKLGAHSKVDVAVWALRQKVKEEAQCRRSSSSRTPSSGRPTRRA